MCQKQTAATRKNTITVIGHEASVTRWPGQASGRLFGMLTYIGVVSLGVVGLRLYSMTTTMKAHAETRRPQEGEAIVPPTFQALIAAGDASNADNGPSCEPSHGSNENRSLGLLDDIIV